MIELKTIYDLLEKHKISLFKFEVAIHEENRIVLSNHTNEFTFYVMAKCFRSYCHKNPFLARTTNELKSFKNWRKFHEGFGTEFNTVSIIKSCHNKLGLKYSDYRHCFWPFFSEMFDLIESRQLDKNNENSNLVSLVPVENDYMIEFRVIARQDWYKKLLQDYTKYTQSSSKSDIADRHYHEQANLHGLKFVIK